MTAFLGKGPIKSYSKHFGRPSCIKGRNTFRLKKQISNSNSNNREEGIGGMNKRRDEPGEFVKVSFHVVIVTSDNSYAAQRVILFAPTVALQPAVSPSLTSWG